MNQFLILSLIIPTLILFPLVLDQEAQAFKLFDQEIVIAVVFVKTEFTNLESLFDDLDDGLIEQNIHDEFLPIAVGQWNFDPSNLADPNNDIISDWSLSINHDTGIHELIVNPIILEINLPQGTNFPTIKDVLIDEGRNIITSKLTNYGVSGEITWTLSYDGETVEVNETLP